MRSCSVKNEKIYYPQLIYLENKLNGLSFRISYMIFKLSKPNSEGFLD